jgi:hypothetical protein
MIKFPLVNDLLSQRPTTRTEKDAGISAYCEYVIKRIEETPVGLQPFGHMYIERILPQGLYADLSAYMQEIKANGKFDPRNQDNPGFSNRKYSLSRSSNPAALAVRSIFSDPGVKLALLSKFYSSNLDKLCDLIGIHEEEFEFTFTQANRFQNIHVDIPPKYLSFVFYMPRDAVDADEARLNGTILYDSNLEPHHNALYQQNSVCIFAPHFNSYHGFSSTIDRDVLVMFYVNQKELQKWRSHKRRVGDEHPFTMIRDVIERKLMDYPLIELGASHEQVMAARHQCLVNAPNGRVINPE